MVPQRSIKLNDAVVLKDDHAPHRGVWAICRVIKVYPDDKGVVRSAEVRTLSGKEFHRPVHKMCLLEAME